MNILKMELSFQDTKEVLLSSDNIGAEFLYGYWMSDENELLECYKQGSQVGIRFNLPVEHFDEVDGWYIKDGVFGVRVKSEKEASSEPDSDFVGTADLEGSTKMYIYENKDLFRMTIIDPDTIAVVCTGNNERIILRREGSS